MFGVCLVCVCLLVFGCGLFLVSLCFFACLSLSLTGAQRTDSSSASKKKPREKWQAHGTHPYAKAVEVEMPLSIRVAVTLPRHKEDSETQSDIPPQAKALSAAARPVTGAKFWHDTYQRA